MKKIYPLTIQALKDELYYALMLFINNAFAKYEVIEQMFAFFVSKFKAAFVHLNSLYKKYDRNFCTQKVHEADKIRSARFRELRESIRWFTLFPQDEAKTQAAEILLKVSDMYGGSSISGKGLNAKTTAITNLVEDIENFYSAEVETLGVGSLMEQLKQAQANFNKAYFDRAECDSEKVKGAMADARKQMDEAYRDLVAAINIQAKEDSEGQLTPFINIMNVEVCRYRVYTGQGPVGASGSGADSDEEDSIRKKTAKFIFKNGNTVSFQVEVGAPLEAPANTEGYRWKPEVPEVMPKTNKTFREVAIDPEKVTALFHFIDHREEEIKQAVGTELVAPQNTEGYVWEPEVPAVMPAEDTSYYEMPAPDNGGGSSSGGSGSTGSGSNQDWDV